MREDNIITNHEKIYVKYYLRILAVIVAVVSIHLENARFIPISHHSIADTVILGCSIVFFIFTLKDSLYKGSYDLINFLYGSTVSVWTLHLALLNNMSDSMSVVYLMVIILIMASIERARYLIYYFCIISGMLLAGVLVYPSDRILAAVNLISVVMISILSLYVNISRVYSKKLVEKNNTLVNDILNTSYDGFIVFDSEYKILKENSSAKTLLGDRYYGGDMREILSDLFKAKKNDLEEFMEFKFKDSSMIELFSIQNENKFLDIMVTRGDIEDYNYYILSLYDNTDKVNNNKTIEYLSNYDTLTLLPNREYIKNNLDEFLMTQKNDSTCVVMLIDLDRFKNINDSYGFAVGDIIITKFSNRLKKVVSRRFKDSSKWQVGRSSADEFLLIIYDYHMISKIISVVEDIMRISKEPYFIYEIKTHITCSIGIAFYPENGLTSDELIKNASLALFNSKKLGGDVYQIYESSIYKDIKGMHIIEEKIKDAMDRNEIVIHYQPIINIKNDEVFSAEALVRWYDSDNVYIPPDQFIPVLESSGLIKTFDIYVVEAVMDFIKKNKSEGLPPISINISAVTYSDLKIVQKIEEIISENNATSLVKLEITETTAMTNVEYSKFVLGELRKSGIKILLDDFGSGYSSLKYLRDFSFDIVKIDKDLIRHVDVDKSVYSVLKACATMGKELGFEVLAEGVETSSEVDKLRELDFGYIQGYYFSKPMNGSSYIEYIKTKRA